MSIFGDAIYFGSGGGSVEQNVDTGLGWSAKGDWLMNAAGSIGELSSAAGGYPVTDTPTFVYTWSPFGRDYYISLYPGYTYPIYVALLGITPDSNYYHAYLIATRGPDQTAAVETHSDSTPTSYIRPGSTDSVTGLRFYKSGTLSYATPYNADIPLYVADTIDNAARLALDAIAAGGQSIASYAKLSSGYSVTCMCKYIDNSTTYLSPVLISSAEANTAYTRNSTAISGTTTHTYEGMTFYMRKGTDDTLSGTETITPYVPLIDLTGDTYTDDTIFTTIMSAANGDVLPTP